MTPLGWILPAPLFLWLSCAAPAAMQAEIVRPKRVLVYTVSAGYVHDVAKRDTPEAPSLVERALVDLGRRTGHFEATLSRDAADFTTENLARYDLVFFYTTGELAFSDAQKSALFEFVKRGKAFAGAHCATDTFYLVPEYVEMIGALFDEHPWHQVVRINVEDHTHPSTMHLGESFEIEDEIYQFKAPYDRAKLSVLMSLDVSKLDLTSDKVHRTDRDFALAWCKEYGRGRVFYTALGHRPEVWTDPRFLKHLDGGLCWAMSLSTDSDATKRAKGVEGGLSLEEIEGTDALSAEGPNGPTIKGFLQSSVRH